MSDKFLAVVKLNTGEEIIAKIEPSPELDLIALDCPAMVGHSSFTKKARNQCYQNWTLDKTRSRNNIYSEDE